MTEVFHGGDLDWAEEWFGKPARSWLDLSTCINPEPYPLPELDGAHWCSLPGRRAEVALRGAAAACYGVDDPALVVPTPGAQSLIQWLPQLTDRATVAVSGPTYGEHLRAWRSAGHDARVVPDLVAAREAGVVVVTNPNNPDGRGIEPALLEGLAAELAGRDGLLVVDEAFADTEPALSLAARAGLPGLVILRSFGKFFGLAGLRLGFALAPLKTAEALRRALGPWAVSGPALAIGTQALSDAGWIAATRRRLKERAARLDEISQGAGLQIIGGTDLFRLIQDSEAPALFEHLGRGGIFVRHFPERPEWLRFGLPDEAGFPRIAAALEGWRRARR